MTTYTFQYMTKEDHANYMMGDNHYHIYHGYAKGKTRQEAIDNALAMFGAGYEVNIYSFKSEAEIKEEERKAAERKAEIEAEAQKKAEAKKIREAQPGYKTRQKWMRVKNEIRKKEKMLADLTAELEFDKMYMNKLATEYKEETGKEIK